VARVKRIEALSVRVKIYGVLIGLAEFRKKLGA